MRALARGLEAVVFDLDGVIINSEPLMRLAFDATYRGAGLPGAPPIESFLEHMGESFPRIMDRLGLPTSLWEPYKRFCRARLDLVALFPGAPPVLEMLTRQGLKLGILTGKDRARTLETLEHFGVGGYFETVVASDELRQPKPHPEGILRALDQLGSSAARAAMVGDSVSDIHCAQRAGVVAIGVSWGIKPARLQAFCRPDHLVHSWGALLDLIVDMQRPLAAAESPDVRP